MHVFFFKSSISQKSSETNLCVFKEVCFHSVYKGVKKDVLEWESRAWTFSPFLFSPSLSSFTIRKTKERELFPVCIWLHKHQKHTVVKHIFITASFFLHLPPQLEEDDGRVTRLYPVRIAQKPGWLPSNCSSSHTLLGCFWVSVCHPKDPAISVCVCACMVHENVTEAPSLQKLCPPDTFVSCVFVFYLLIPDRNHKAFSTQSVSFFGQF